MSTQWHDMKTVEQINVAFRYIDFMRKHVRVGEEVYSATWLPSPTDVLKSSLLARMLSGKLPFRDAPPKSYSYPWYDAIEGAGPHWIPTLGNNLQPEQIIDAENPAIAWLNQDKYDVLEVHDDESMTLGYKSWRFACWRGEKIQQGLGRNEQGEKVFGVEYKIPGWWLQRTPEALSERDEQALRQVVKMMVSSLEVTDQPAPWGLMDQSLRKLEREGYIAFWGTRSDGVERYLPLEKGLRHVGLNDQTLPPHTGMWSHTIESLCKAIFDLWIGDR